MVIHCCILTLKLFVYFIEIQYGLHNICYTFKLYVYKVFFNCNDNIVLIYLVDWVILHVLNVRISEYRIKVRYVYQEQFCIFYLEPLPHQKFFSV